jgi:hypothetical protein
MVRVAFCSFHRVNLLPGPGSFQEGALREVGVARVVESIGERLGEPDALIELG